MYLFARTTVKGRVRLWPTIHLSNQLPVHCYLFQKLFAVSVSGGGGRPPVLEFGWCKESKN